MPLPVVPRATMQDLKLRTNNAAGSSGAKREENTKAFVPRIALIGYALRRYITRLTMRMLAWQDRHVICVRALRHV